MFIKMLMKLREGLVDSLENLLLIDAPWIFSAGHSEGNELQG